MRLASAATAAVVLAACGPKAEPHTTQNAPVPITCDNVVAAPIGDPAFDAMVEDLGTLTVGTTVPFQVPGGTAAFFIVSQALGTAGDGSIDGFGATGLPNVVVPTTVKSPSAVYYDDWAAVPTTTIAGLSYSFDYTTTLVEPGLDPAVGVFSFPNTSGALRALASSSNVVETGSWQLTVNDWAYECAQSGSSCTGGSAASQYHVYVVTRPTPTSTPTLDVDVYLATDPATSALPDASTATTSVQVARWEQSLQQYLGNGGIALGNVAFHDLPAAAKAQYAPNGDVDVSSSGPCSNLSQLFTTGSSQTRGVSIFLADGFTNSAVGSGTFRVAGIDGSIPGPSGFPGTINSGAAVSLESFGFEKTGGACALAAPLDIGNCGTDLTAYVTAHEIGHWLGLYHVTEQDGTSFDPLDDTAVCACHACAATQDQPSCADFNPSASTPTLITADRCVAGGSCGGGDNLMFWMVSPTYSTGALSPEQQQVIHLNPAVH